MKVKLNKNRLLANALCTSSAVQISEELNNLCKGVECTNCGFYTTGGLTEEEIELRILDYINKHNITIELE